MIKILMNTLIRWDQKTNSKYGMIKRGKSPKLSFFYNKWLLFISCKSRYFLI